MAVSNPRRIWQSLQHITNYRDGGSSRTANPKVSGAEELNRFFGRFEINRSVLLHPPASTLFLKSQALQTITAAGQLHSPRWV